MQIAVPVRKSAIAAFLLLLATTGCDAQHSSGTATRMASAGGASKSVQVNDPAWGMIAATVTIPANWGFAGTIVHVSNCAVTGHSLKLNAESPDQLTGVETLPALQSMWISDPRTMAQLRQQGCPVSQSVHAADFVQNVILPHTHPNARVIGAQPFADFQPIVDAKLASLRQARAQGTGANQPMPTVEGTRVRISYERNGHAEEENILAVVMCMPFNLPNLSTIGCLADSITSVHAPAGQLDAMFAAKPVLNTTFNPAWEARLVQQTQQDNYNVQQQQAAERQRIHNMGAQALANQQAATNSILANSQAQMAANRAQFNASMTNAKNVQNSIDRSTAQTVGHMSDTNGYSNGANGNQYTGLSNQYNHTYDNGQGTIVQTNSAYAPGSPGIWTELTPKY